MWKKIKENWKTYLLVILSALFGADQAQEYGFIGAASPPVDIPRKERPAPERPAPPAWTVVVDFSQVKTIGGGALPSFEFEDERGRETVFVQSISEPSEKEIIYSFYGADPPPKIRVDIIDVTAPDETRPEKPSPPEDTE